MRPLQGRARIAPLLATIGISFVLDQLVQLICSPDPRARAELTCRTGASPIGGGSIGPMDLLIAGVGLTSAALLYVFLRFTKLGWAVRATAQDRDAAQQMGVNVDAVNSAVFAIASALGGVSGLLVGMYYNHIDPAMSFQATLKGVVAVVIGGVGNVPGAIVGSLLLGLDRELRHRAVRHDLPQSVRVRAADPVPGAAPERPVRRHDRGRRRAADRHLHRAEPAADAFPRRSSPR